MKTIHNTFLDLSKLTREEKDEIFSMLPAPYFDDDYRVDERYIYLTRNSRDTEWFVAGFGDSYLENKTEVSLSEFRELFASSYLPKENDKSAKDFLLESFPYTVKDKFDLELQQFSADDMISFAENYHEFLTTKNQ